MIDFWKVNEVLVYMLSVYYLSIYISLFLSFLCARKRTKKIKKEGENKFVLR